MLHLCTQATYTVFLVTAVSQQFSKQTSTLFHLPFLLKDETLTRTEAQKAQLEAELTKISAEESSLRDAIHKMQALNEGLAQDKIDLNKVIAQVKLPKINFKG